MMMKALIGIVLLAVAAGGLWWSGLLKDYLPPNMGGTAMQQATTTPETPTQPAAQPPVTDLPTASDDASDAAIAQDSAAVDVQMQGLSSDEAGADQSINDKPTAQEF